MKPKSYQRKKTYVEMARKRERADNRKELRRRMKAKNKPKKFKYTTLDETDINGGEGDDEKR